MKQILLVITFIGLSASVVFAHLCNDVFIQAKDNLAVKVDIRDNQLRLNKSAEFKVFLLNTMDRAIENIQLEIVSDHFQAEVKPSSDWSSFPRLYSKTQRGKKEHFNVHLRRMPGTEPGKYKIGLRLFNGLDHSMVFKTVDIDDAMGTMIVPKKAMSLKIDGQVSRDEWQNSLLCTSFYEYRFKPSTEYTLNGHYVKGRTDIQTRVRFSHDENDLYCMVDFLTKSPSDIVTIYIAQDYESSPRLLTINLQGKKVYLPGFEPAGLDFKFLGTKTEIKIPFNALRLSNPKSFYVNIMRSYDKKKLFLPNKIKTFWRGNEYSIKDPIVYANFTLK